MQIAAMPKNKAAASGSKDENTSAPKKSKPVKAASSSSKPDEDETPWHIGDRKFVKITEFKGHVNVDIRQFYEKDGELLPTKKGISLTPIQWRKLTSMMDEITKGMEEKC